MNGLVLGFDTSAAHCAAALVSDGRLVAQRREEMTKGQAERLFPMLEDLLAEAGAGWRDLSAIGVGTGPGNFTGTRIAVAAARGLALSLKVPAEGVSAFEAAVYGLPHPVTAALDARQGRLYLQRFDAGDEGEPLMLEADAPLPAGFPAADPVTGSGSALWAARSGAPEILPATGMAEAIARIAASRAAPDRPRPAPVYLRPPDAVPAPPPPVVVP